jgi:homoserine kinase type II
MQLQHVPLPFVVPVPIPIHTGEPLLQLLASSNNAVLLYPFVLGTHSMGNNRRQAYAAGRALAIVQAALITLDHARLPHSMPRPVAGELHRAHPLVSDPVAALEGVPVDRHQKERLWTLMDAMVTGIPQLYTALPRQLIHNDYDPSNVLLAGQRVTGILDWEFSTVDLRAMDLAVALCWWPRAPFQSARRWAIMDAFGEGYTRYTLLTADEIEALPFLIRLRTVVTLLHRVGRYLAGRDSEHQLVQRISWTLNVDEWMTSVGDELRRRVRTWQVQHRHKRIPT